MTGVFMNLLFSLLLHKRVKRLFLAFVLLSACGKSTKNQVVSAADINPLQSPPIKKQEIESTMPKEEKKKKREKLVIENGYSSDALRQNSYPLYVFAVGPVAIVDGKEITKEAFNQVVKRMQPTPVHFPPEKIIKLLIENQIRSTHKVDESLDYTGQRKAEEKYIAAQRKVLKIEIFMQNVWRHEEESLE